MTFAASSRLKGAKGSVSVSSVKGAKKFKMDVVDENYHVQIPIFHLMQGKF